MFKYLDDLNYIELKNPFFSRMTFSKNENNQEFMEQLILVLVSRNNIDLVRKTYGSPDELLFGQTSDKKKLVDFKLSLLFTCSFVDLVKTHEDCYDKDKII